MHPPSAKTASENRQQRRASLERDGYRRSNRGTKGVRTMSLDEDDGIVVVRRALISPISCSC